MTAVISYCLGVARRCPMSSLIEELQRREAAARQEVDELRGEIARLNDRPARARPAAGQVADAAAVAGPAPAGSRVADGSPVGVMTVPPWRPGLTQSVLPPSYQDLLEVLADAGRPLRAGRIAAAAGLSTGKSNVEGLRSKLKRLAERGWLAGEAPGLFMLPRRDAQDASSPAPEGGQAGSSS